MNPPDTDTVPRPFRAIAAMSLNRVIGKDNRIPWHLPEDFRWFKRVTLGHVLVMGRKTFESIGRPLPGRTTVVLSRTWTDHPGVEVARSLDEVRLPSDGRQVFLCGGAEIYVQGLDRCAELFLTVVQREVEGDAYFPPFEDRFAKVETVLKADEFVVEHYHHR